jgi:hypothetical protein
VSRQVFELENLLGEMIAEHRRLLKQAEVQQAAMKVLDLKAMDDCAKVQEASRLRLANLETKRRLIVAQIARLHGVHGNLTVPQIAEFYPHRKTMLMNLRETLKAEMNALASRNHVAGRLAGAVVGHLNTVVRLLAGAVEKAGLYTRQGIPQVSTRIGVMDAVG